MVATQQMRGPGCVVSCFTFYHYSMINHLYYPCAVDYNTYQLYYVGHCMYIFFVLPFIYCSTIVYTYPYVILMRFVIFVLN